MTDSDPLIEFRDVYKAYIDDIKVLKDINLEIGVGEFVSVAGASGAGKTTLMKLILVEIAPTKGDVLYDKTRIHSLSRDEITEHRRRIGMVFQDFRLLPHKTAYENIAFAMEAAGRSDEDIESDVPYALELVNLSDKMWSFPQELSGGQKQRLAIARAIVNNPDVVIADEPTGNLDPNNANEVIEILKKINDLGTTVLLTTHNKDVVDALENRVITMEGGEIIRDAKTGKYIL
ncbi:MAG: ATP-binding cassette domain-containing protein [Candidatus Paceibacterota bacterium]